MILSIVGVIFLTLISIVLIMIKNGEIDICKLDKSEKGKPFFRVMEDKSIEIIIFGYSIIYWNSDIK